MPEFFVGPLQRGHQTEAVWQQYHELDFKIGKTDYPLFVAAVALVETRLQELTTATTVLDGAIGELGVNSTWLKDLSKRGAAIMEASFDEEESYDDQAEKLLDKVFSIKMESEALVTKRARLFGAAWGKLNEARAASAFVLPPFEVPKGAISVTLSNYLGQFNLREGLLVAVQDAEAAVGEAHHNLHAAVRKVDRLNKKWYLAWKNSFAEGTPERDALAQITVEDSSSAPNALEIAAITPQAGGKYLVSYAADGGEGATGLFLLHQVVGTDAGFAHAVEIVRAGQLVGPFPAGSTVNFATRVSNTAGSSQSATKTVTV